MSLRTSFFIDLAGNMVARANQFLGGLQRLGTQGSHSMTVLNRTIAATGRGLDRLGNRYTAMLSGAAGVGTVKQVGDLSMRLTRLGINAEVSRVQIDRLYGKIMDVALMKDVHLNPGEILSGVEKIVQKLGDLDLATRHTRTIALAIQATGGQGEEVGDLIANFKEKYQLKDAEILPGLDILVKQGKAGAFELKDLVTQGNRLTASYGAMGRTGLKAVREMGAFMQVAKKSTGSPEETSTAWKNVFSDLMEPSKQKYLKALKISIWEPDKLKAGKKEIRSIIDIIGEILQKTKGDPEKMNRIFGMQSLDGIKAFISEYQKTGKNAADEFMNITGDGTTLMRDAAVAAKELNSAVQNLYTSWQRFSQSNLAKPLKAAADAINSLDPKTVDLWLKILTYGGGALGGAILAKKGWNGIQTVRGWFKKSGKPGSGLPEGVPGAGNAVPVYVVNMPGSIPGSPVPSTPGAPVPSPGAPAGKPGKFGKVISGLGKASLAFSGGYAVGTGINYVIDAVTKTATGGRADSLGALLYDLLHKQKEVLSAGKKTEVGGKIKIEIQQNGRASVTEIKSNNQAVPIDVSTGYMMMGM